MAWRKAPGATALRRGHDQAQSPRKTTRDSLQVPEYGIQRHSLLPNHHFPNFGETLPSDSSFGKGSAGSFKCTLANTCVSYRLLYAMSFLQIYGSSTLALVPQLQHFSAKGSACLTSWQWTRANKSTVTLLICP